MLDAGSISLERSSGAAFAISNRSPAVNGLALSSAAMLDRELARLGRSEAWVRREIGLLAERFLAIRGYDPLGFIRAGDYAVERLGISGRELRSLAFVASRLEGLPLVRRSYLSGRISWTRARLLASVASPASEASWLARAEERSTEALACEVEASRGAVAGEELDDAVDEAFGTIEGEERVRISIHCPGRIRSLWQRAVEIARRMIGSEAPIWHAAEAIAAEALSELPLEASPREDVDPVAAPAIERVSMSGSAVPGPQSDADFDEEPISVEDLDCDLEDPFALDGALRSAVSRLRRLDAALGRRLALAAVLRVHRPLGFPSLDAYVRERLGISPAKARALIAIERRGSAAEVRRAFADGALSWSRVLAILPVTDGGRGRAWVERASEVTVRQLRDEVEWALERRDVLGAPPLPPPPDLPLEMPDLQIGATAGDELAERRVTFSAPESVAGLLRAAVSARTAAGEPSWRGLERMLLAVLAEWDAQPRHRDPIFARGGWRCAVPGCSSRRNLHDHHLAFRSRGGGNEQANRVPVCAAHHLNGIHRGVIRASGRAPDDVVWELGVRIGLPPLLVLHGDRYRGIAP